MSVKRSIVVGAAMFAAGCGGSSPSAPSGSGSSGGSSVATNTIVITSAGVDNRDIVISAGSRVRFVNNDNRTHQINSNPHPEHTDCPELNLVDFLQPGESRETGNLVNARTCGFHDHIFSGTANLQGRITIR